VETIETRTDEQPVKTVTTRHESAVEFLLRWVRDKQADNQWADQAQHHLNGIFDVRSKAVAEDYHGKFGEEGVYVASLPRQGQSGPSGKVTLETHEAAAHMVVEGSHRLATGEEVEVAKRERDINRDALAAELKESFKGTPGNPGVVGEVRR
jgi:hypothetical protein